MNRVVGGSLPADIWREIMLAAHEARPPATAAGRGDLERFAASVPLRCRPRIRRKAIGDDFIARALQDAPPAPEETGAAQSRPLQDGRMSLGRFRD